MQATTKVKDLLWQVSTLLNDAAPQFNRWSEQELVGYLNDGQMAVTKYFPSACSRVDAIRLKPGSRQSIETIAAADCKPIDGSVPTGPVYGMQPLDFICNMGADGQTPGEAIPAPVDRRTLDAVRSDWRAVTGSKVYEVAVNPSTPMHFDVRPAVPATPAVWIMLGYVAKPARIAAGAPGAELHAFAGSSTTVIGVDDANADELVDYVCARALTKNADFAANTPGAAFFTQRFLGSINLRLQALTGNNPAIKRLPFAPEPVAAAS